MVVHDKNIFGFDVSMEDSGFVVQIVKTKAELTEPLDDKRFRNRLLGVE